jgi:hypothetical protein
MNDTDINDTRLSKDFKGVTFSKYKKTEVKRELLNNILEEKIESACNWCAELVCAGHYVDLWETILLLLGKNIHLANPKLPLYVMARYQHFREIVGGGYVGNELAMRNNPGIRKLFCEMVCVLCFSNKKNRLGTAPIDTAEAFDISKLSRRLKAPDMTFAQSYFLAEDPKEIFITVNEFAYSISPDVRDPLKACYWVEWIIEFDSRCRRKKELCRCERRSFAPVEGKFQMDSIWIFWEIILDLAGKDGPVRRIVDAILALFCIRYKTPCIKKRRFLIYFAISVLTDRLDLGVSMIPSKGEVEKIVSNIDAIYRQIKKGEDSPNTDYLFANAKQSGLDKTIQKMEIVNQHALHAGLGPVVE